MTFLDYEWKIKGFKITFLHDTFVTSSHFFYLEERNKKLVKLQRLFISEMPRHFPGFFAISY